MLIRLALDRSQGALVATSSRLGPDFGSAALTRRHPPAVGRCGMERGVGGGRRESGGDVLPASRVLLIFKELSEKTKERVVISDVNEKPSAEALPARVIAMPGYIDYFLR